MGEKHPADDSAAGEVIGRARNHLAKALEGLERVEGEDRDRAVHEVRKRIKKARALIELTRGPVGRKAIEKAGRKLREATRPLSAVRDATALLQALADVADRHDGMDSPGLIAEIRASLEAHRDEIGRESLGDESSIAQLAKAIRSTRRRLEKWDPSPEEGLDYRRAYRQARELSEAANEDPSPEVLHEFRKRVKVLEYQLATVEADPAGPVARIRRLAGLLADELGQIHDLDVLRDFLARADEANPFLEPIGRRRLGLRHDALRRAGVVFLEKPRIFEKMIKLAAKSEPVPSEV